MYRYMKNICIDIDTDLDIDIDVDVDTGIDIDIDILEVSRRYSSTDVCLTTLIVQLQLQKFCIVNEDPKIPNSQNAKIPKSPNPKIPKSQNSKTPRFQNPQIRKSPNQNTKPTSKHPDGFGHLPGP